MASTINASTSSGIVQTADTSGILQLQTAGTTAITVNASQNVGIGTTTPSAKLNVNGGNLDVTGSATPLIRIIENTSTGNPKLQLLDYSNASSPTEGTELWYESSTGNSYLTSIFSGGGLIFRTGGTNERMNINSSGNVSINGTYLSPFTFKNYIINGNFDFWQRGTTNTITTSGLLCADRWQYITDGTLSTGSVFTQQSFTNGQTDVPNNPIYYLNWQYTNVNTPSNYIRQRIENVNTLNGQTITISAWIKCASGTVPMGMSYQQEFGTGGSPSGGYYPAGVTFTATTTWTKYTATLNVASISGKTIGTNGDSAINIAIYTTASGGTSNTLSVAQVQVERGSNATQFEWRPLQMELALCQRYYEKSYDVNVNPGTNTTVGVNYQIATSDGSGNGGITVFFKVPKRSITGATFTVYQQGGTSGSWNYSRSGASGTTTVNTPFLGTNGGLIYFGVGANYVACSLYGHWTMNCEL